MEIKEIREVFRICTLILLVIILLIGFLDLVTRSHYSIIKGILSGLFLILIWEMIDRQLEKKQRLENEQKVTDNNASI